MSKTKKTTVRRAVTVRLNKNLLHLRGSEIAIQDVYLRLETSGRGVFKDLLLRHLSLPCGLNSYVEWGHNNELERRSSYLLLRTKASPKMANAWHRWAFDISENQTSQDARRDAIFYMLAQIVRSEFLEEEKNATA
jgi:hypothetical protein